MAHEAAVVAAQAGTHTPRLLDIEMWLTIGAATRGGGYGAQLAAFAKASAALARRPGEALA